MPFNYILGTLSHLVDWAVLLVISGIASMGNAFATPDGMAPAVTYAEGAGVSKASAASFTMDTAIIRIRLLARGSLKGRKIQGKICVSTF